MTIRCLKYWSSLFVVLTVAWSAWGQTASPDPIAFQETVLDNGLRVITVEDFSTPLVEAQVWYHVGSKNESPNRQGFAHLFEHLMFRGSDVVDMMGHFNLIRGVGGTNNAFTDFDCTAYINTVPAEQLPLVLWLESERLAFLNIDAEGFATERKIVEEERRVRCLNTPYGTLPEQILQEVCTQHPYRWLPIGRISHLRAAALPEVKQFWDTYYVPSNAVLLIVGAVEHEEAVRQAETFFGWMPSWPSPPPVTVVEPPQTEERRVRLKERLGPLPLVAVTYRTVSRNHPDAPRISLLERILVNGQSSRLYERLRRGRMPYSAKVYSMNFSLEQDGALAIISAVQPARYVVGMLNPFSRVYGKGMLRAIDREIRRIQEEGVTEQELEKAKNGLLRDAIWERQTLSGLATTLGEAAVVRQSTDWINEQWAVVASITREDLQDTAQTYLVPERRTVAWVTPDKKFEYDPDLAFPPTDAPVAQKALSKAGLTRPEDFPTSPPLADLSATIPEIEFEEKTLSNGLKVVVVPDHRLPIVTAALGLDYGEWAEPPDRPGAAKMVFALLSKGTEHFSDRELAETLDANALTVSAAAQVDASMVSVSGLSTKRDLAVELLAEMVRRPTFPSNKVKREKWNERIALRQGRKQASYLASREFYRRLWGDNPYGRAANTSWSSIGRIDRRDVVRWWETRFRPEAATLYLVGDIEPEEAYTLVDTSFGDWRVDTPSPQPNIDSPDSPQETRIYLVDVPGAPQSEIRVGQLASGVNDPDYHKTKVFSQIYGGAFGSRLNDELRVKNGLTYYAAGGFEARRFGGAFTSRTFTKAESAADAVRIILEVMQSMRDTPPTGEELTLAKTFLAGSVPLHRQTVTAVMSELWQNAYLGLPPNAMVGAITEYAKTEQSDIVRMATKQLDSEKLIIVVAGDAESIREPLSAIAPVIMCD